MKKKLIKLHPLDNVQIAVGHLSKGDVLLIEGDEVIITEEIAVGNKVAEKILEVGHKVIKYGVPIGSVTIKVKKGALVHLHNMKSDYIPTYTIESEFKDDIN